MAAKKKSGSKKAKRSNASKKPAKRAAKRSKRPAKRAQRKPSPEAQTRKLVIAYSKAWAEADLKKLDALTSERIDFHNPPPGFSADKQGVLESARLMHEAFPDQQLELDHVIASKDQAACHFKVSGTHEGEFMGLPPTGRRIEIEGVTIVKVRNGQVVEDITEIDTMRLMDQLGAPSPLANAQAAGQVWSASRDQPQDDASQPEELSSELWGAPYRE